MGNTIGGNIVNRTFFQQDLIDKLIWRYVPERFQRSRIDTISKVSVQF